MCFKWWVRRTLWQRDCKRPFDFHRSVPNQAVAHLNLLHDNTFRTPWLVAKLLSTDKALAKSSVVALAGHLVPTRLRHRTSFEYHMFTQWDLWENLEVCSKAEPPVILWGKPRPV